LNRFNDLPDSTKGALFLMVAALGFSLMAALIKAAGENLHVTQILFVRQAGMVVMALPAVLANFPGSLKTRRLDLQLTRVGFAIVAMLFGFSAVIHMPLADAVALGFTKGLFVTVFAVLILQERVGAYRWGAVVVGLIGVVVMLRPGTGGISLYGVYAVVGAACAGAVMVIIRLLSRYDHPNTILTYQSLGVGIAMLIPAVYFWNWPTPVEWTILLGIACVSYLAQLCNIYAHKWGEASMLASLDYTRLLYAALIGWLVFDTFPDAITWVGAGIIIGASILIVYREHKLKRASRLGLPGQFS
jgi:drug/metabolite transporter (DMT)-like permease